MGMLLAISFPSIMILIILFLIGLGEFLVTFINLPIDPTPFILPTRFQLLHETPRILYNVGNLRMRTLDMMLYSLMLSLLYNYSYAGIIGGFFTIIGALVIVVFILPYFGLDKIRPFPIALTSLFLYWCLYETIETNLFQTFNADLFI